jgi:hypothetical protein
MLTDDLIHSLDQLKNNGKVTPDIYQDPVKSIITPEWYDSNGYSAFNDVNLNWNDLEKDPLICDMAHMIEENDTDKNLRMGFESDFCSWYQPYHFLPRVNWGIHIRYSSLLSIAARFNLKCHNIKSKPIDCVKASFFYLYLHEIFHYLVENSSTVIEIILGKETLYRNYLSNVYAKLFNTFDCLEETLANCYLFERCELYGIDKAFLKAELLRQNPGYSNFLTYGEPNFGRGIRRLVSQIKSTTAKPPISLPIENILDIVTPVDKSHGHLIPIWLHKRPKPLH